MRAFLAALAIVGSAQADTNGPVLSARNDFEMGVRFMQDRKYAGAIQVFQRVIEERPDFYEAYNNLGI